MWVRMKTTKIMFQTLLVLSLTSLMACSKTDFDRVDVNGKTSFDSSEPLPLPPPPQTGTPNTDTPPSTDPDSSPGNPGAPGNPNTDGPTPTPVPTPEPVPVPVPEVPAPTPDNPNTDNPTPTPTPVPDVPTPTPVPDVPTPVPDVPTPPPGFSLPDGRFSDIPGVWMVSDGSPLWAESGGCVRTSWESFAIRPECESETNIVRLGLVNQMIYFSFDETSISAANKKIMDHFLVAAKTSGTLQLNMGGYVGEGTSVQLQAQRAVNVLDYVLEATKKGSSAGMKVLFKVKGKKTQTITCEGNDVRLLQCLSQGRKSPEEHSFIIDEIMIHGI